MRVFNATPLYVLDICEVCGSFQCPYCPHFSSAPPAAADIVGQLITIIISLCINYLLID